MIKIYGASDDLVEVEGCKGADEFGVYSSDDRSIRWRGGFIAPWPNVSGVGGQLRVYGLFDGCWHFSVGQVDEDARLPGWPITVQQHALPDGRVSHSAELLIDAPEGTRLTNLWLAVAG